MNLIEQLGYEYAKEIYLSNLEDFSGNASGATISTEKLRFTHEELEKALLEYRRQHNIFEVGDYFCYEKKYLSSDPLDGNDYEKLNQIDKVDFLCGWIELVVKRGGVIRHATNAEIKAGKRLEVV